MWKGCTSKTQIYGVDPASGISFALTAFFLFPQVVPCLLGKSCLGWKWRAGLHCFYLLNKFVFLLYRFLSLVFMHLSMCIWECVGKPCIPGRRSHSYRSLGLGKGAAIPKPGLCNWAPPRSFEKFSVQAPLLEIRGQSF